MKDWLPDVSERYDRDLDLVADVCVIGTGAGGAVVASELAEAGRSVVMLEKGGYHTRRTFNQRERDMMPLLFEDAGGRSTLDGGINLLQGTSVGGGTTVNWAICFDPPEAVLDDWSDRFGLERLRASDLVQDLAKVRHVLNVQPLPDSMVNANGRMLIEGARRLGMTGRVFEHSRTSCLGSGFCMLGCAYDRKQSMLVTYVPRALHFGARLHPRVEAQTLEIEGDRVKAVVGTATDHSTGRQFRVRVRAHTVIVAGGAISTPLFLLKNGLGRQLPRLGENLALHPATAAIGLFERELRSYEGIHYSTFVSDLEPKGILLESVFGYPGLIGSNTYAWGERSTELMARYNHLAAAIVLLHDESRGSVSVGDGGRPAIRYWLNDHDQAKFREGLMTLARIYFAAGAQAVYVPNTGGLMLRSAQEVEAIASLPMRPNDLAAFSAHQMGTAAMGRTAADSVTDAWGRVHGMANLYISDSSLFPTSLGVNPQITIATLATRVGRHLAGVQTPAVG